MGWIQKKTKSLFSKTVLAALTVSLTVLILVAVIMFSWFRTKMVDGYRQLTQTVIGNMDSAFSRDISDAKNLTAEWFSSADGACMRLDPNADFLNHMSFVNKVLNAMTGYSYMQSFCIINREHETALLLSSNVSHPDHLEDYIVEQVTRSGEKNKPFIWKVKKQYTENETIALLSIPISESLITSDQYTGTAVLSIDLQQLRKSLFADFSDDGFRLMILDENGVVVSHDNPELIGEDWSDKVWVHRILNGETQFELKDKEGRWEFMAQSAKVNGYYIVAQSEYVARILNINYTFYILILVVTIAAITIILMMLLVSRRIFEPFTEMVGNLRRSSAANELKESKGEKDEAEADEIAFLNGFYQGISGHLEVMKEKKEHDFIIKNLLLGNQQQEIAAMLHEKGIIYRNVPYSMVLVFVENRDSAETYNMQEYDMLRTMVSGIYSSVLEEYGPCSCFELGLRRMLFFVSRKTGEEQKEKTLKELVANAELSVRRLSAVQSYCLISELLRDEGEDCVNNFRRMNECLKTRQLLGAEEAAVMPVGDQVFPEVDTEELVDCLRRRDKEGYLNAMEDQLKICGMMPYPVFAAQLELIAASVLKAGRISRSTLSETIAAISGKEELFMWLESLYDEAALQIGRISSHSSAAMMEEAIDYIRNNYDDSNLGVNLLAEKLNISTTYFGKLFTEFTGTKTLDYILKIRMEKARDLLVSEPEQSISQIAAAVGYNNSTYFTTAFKKYYGVTPSKFRELHQES